MPPVLILTGLFLVAYSADTVFIVEQSLPLLLPGKSVLRFAIEFSLEFRPTPNMSRLFTLTTLLCFTATLTSSAQEVMPTKAPWNIRTHLPLDHIVVQSHRGAGVLAEEGTLEAFELGWKLGTWPEADLRATKDGVIVSFHDTTFARVLKNPPDDLQKKGVEDLTYAAVAQLDVGERKGEAFKERRVLAMAGAHSLLLPR